MYKPVSTDRLFPSGDLEICQIVGGQLVRRWYQGYTKREALRLFKKELSKVVGNVIKR